MAKPKLTLQQQYDNEIKRIEKLIKNAESIGFEWVQTPIPPKPKRVTEASVQKLKKITPQNIYKTAVYNDPISQTQFTGEQGQTIVEYRKQLNKSNADRIKEAKKKQPRPKQITNKAKKSKPARKEITISNNLSKILDSVVHILSEYDTENDRLYYRKIEAINTILGRINVAQSDTNTLRAIDNYIQTHNVNLESFAWGIIRASMQEQIDGNLNEIMNVLNVGHPISLSENDVLTEISEDLQGFDVI